MHRADTPAIALLEFASIARALRTGDAMVKRATVQVAYAGPISPGRYLILITGRVAEVEESWQAGVADGEDAIVDHLYLPGVHEAVVKAIHGATAELDVERDALGIIETSTVSAAIVACDAACKTAEVRVLDMRLGKGIGGKGVFTLAGSQFDLEAALDAGCEAIASRRALVGRELIPRPDALFQGGLR